METYITPVTPIYQPGAFGAMEPAVTHVMSDFIIPSSEYKWNQIIELQLPDGKKVFFSRSERLFIDKSILSLDGG